MSMNKRNVADSSILQLEMPDIVGLPRNWDVLIEYLRQRRYTSGDVESCIGVSRKVLKDWDGARNFGLSSIRGSVPAEGMNGSANGGSFPFSTFGTWLFISASGM
jgi:hypothetical protein